MPKPPRPEAQYFGQIDVRQKRRMSEARRDEQEREERQRLRELHRHHCGLCGGQLEAQSFKGESVLRCRGCSATLLERGVLERLSGPERRWVQSFLDIFRF